MKTIKLKTINDEKIILSVNEILIRLTKKFPEGFSSGKASYFLKSEYNLSHFSLNNSGIINYLLERGVIAKKYQGEHKRHKYKVNQDKLSEFQSEPIEILREPLQESVKIHLDTIVNDYDKLITRTIEDGTLKQGLLDDLRFTLINYYEKIR